VTLLGAEAQAIYLLLSLGVGVAGGNGPQRWVPEDGRAGRSREEASSLRWVIPCFRMRSSAAWVHGESVAEFTARMERLEALTCPTDRDIPFFNQQAEIADRHGLNYRESLEFIICVRNGGAD